MSEVTDRSPLPEALFRADDLPTIPAVAVEVLHLCRDEDTTLDDLAEALSYDLALSARLLRFANSSLYNLGSEVSTLQRAALVLGMKTVQLMALSFSLAGSLPRGSSTNRFDYEGFWRRSLIRAVAGRALAGRVGALIEDEAFLCGLLSEVGQIVLTQCMTDEYEEVLDRAAGAWPRAVDELALLGFDHGDVGQALLRSWEFPELICDAPRAAIQGIACDPGDHPQRAALVQVLSIAGDVTQLLTEQEPRAALASIEARGQQAFGLTADQVQEFLESLDEGVREASEMLNVKLPPGRTGAEILAEARGELLQRSVGHVRALEDAHAAAALEHRARILADPALSDPLTGVPNQEAFDRFLKKEVGVRLAGLVRPLGVLHVKIDQLESLATTFGEATRDEVLRLVGATLMRLVRRSDLPARIADEFAIVLGDASPFGLKVLAERLRRGVEEQSLTMERGAIAVTITLGGACLGTVSSRTDGLALREVARRYAERASARGHNRSLLHPGLLHPPGREPESA